VRAGGVRAGDRRPRPRAQDGILGDQRPVEVERERRDRLREVGRELDGDV